MLYGRNAEQERLARMVADAVAGTSGALVIHGEAGIGKTALLDHLAANPGQARVLRTTGIESETELPFAALHQLLRPALRRLELLPEPQADALRAAFGLVTPGGQDRFLIGLAVLTLLSEYAGEDPVLCLVDDAQWVDQASMDALTFAARRLDAEGVVMLFALREPPRLGLPELRLDGLDEAATIALLASRELPAHAREQVVAQARGNPLALIELPQSMTEDHLPGGLVPPTPSARVQAVFRTQIEHLPEPTRTVLLVAAADDTGDPAAVLAAAGAAVTDLEPAEKAGLIHWAGPALAFRHPLVRTASYHAATLAQRIAAHQALAAALHGDEHADRRAWHRAAAAIGPDERAAEELDRAAERASRRHGTAAAASAYDRAAQLSADPEARQRRLVAAAQAAADAGQFPRVAALLARATDDTTDTGSSELARARAALELNSGSAAKAVELLLDHTEGIGILAEACHAAMSAGDAELLARVGDRAGSHGVVTALAALFDSRAPADSRVFARTARDKTALFSERFLAAHAAQVSADHDDAHELATHLRDYCRSHGLRGWQASSLHLLAETQLALGRLDRARQTAEEALRIAEYGGLEHRACHLRATLATLAALHGDENTCRDLAETALTHATAHRIGTAAAHAHHALALFHLGAGDPEPALVHLVDIPPGPSTVDVLPDLVEAGTRTGADVTDAVARYERWAKATARPITAALAARCHALASPQEQHFTTALAHHEKADAPFEQARTHLLYGEWLRRQRRRTDARHHLRAALETFEQAGANPWAERARAELRGTGDVIDPARETGTPLDRLTPQEREVVQLAATGATNREIATQLFLSPRTVGHHLYRAFPKLGITARTQLTEIIT